MHVLSRYHNEILSFRFLPVVNITLSNTNAKTSPPTINCFLYMHQCTCVDVSLKGTKEALINEHTAVYFSTKAALIGMVLARCICMTFLLLSPSIMDSCDHSFQIHKSWDIISTPIYKRIKL